MEHEFLPEHILQRLKNVFSFEEDKNIVENVLGFVKWNHPYGYSRLDRQLMRRYIEDITNSINERLGVSVKDYFNKLDEDTLKTCMIEIQDPGVTTDHAEIWIVENREETDDEWTDRLIKEIDVYKPLWEHYKENNTYAED